MRANPITNRKLGLIAICIILSSSVFASSFIAPSAAAIDWNVTLTATLDAFSATIVFGVRGSATNGFDPTFDQVAPPNPVQGVASWFYYPDNPASPVDLRRLSTSMISEASSMVWTYKVLSISSEGTMQITWSPTEMARIPSSYIVSLQDSSGKTLVNMRNTSSYSYLSAADSTTTFIIKLESQNLVLDGVTGWYWTDNTVINSVAVGDVDGDGQKEIVTGGTFNDGVRNVAQLIIWDSSGLTAKKLTTWYWTDDTVINSLSIGDVDGDGHIEIVTGGYFNDDSRKVAQLIVWDSSSLVAKKITSWYWTGDTVINSVAVSDVDSDGQVEIVTGGFFNDGIHNNAQLIVWTGSDLSVDRLTCWCWTDNTVINSVAVGDVDGDGQKEIVTGGTFNDGTRIVAQLVVWTGVSLTVDRLTSWYWTGNTVINSVAIGDVDNDGQTEIVTGGCFNDSARNVAQLIVWTGSNLTVDKLTAWYWSGNTVINSVSLGDVNSDAQIEIVTGGYFDDGIRNIAQLVAWSGSSLAFESIQTWYWVNNTIINSISLNDINNDSSAEITTGGSYYDQSRVNAQLALWT